MVLFSHGRETKKMCVLVIHCALWQTVSKLSDLKSSYYLLLLYGLPWCSDSKESACNVGDLGLIPGFRRSFGEGNGYPLQYSGLENSMDCVVHRVSKSWTQLSHFLFSSYGCVGWLVLARRFLLGVSYAVLVK